MSVIFHELTPTRMVPKISYETLVSYVLEIPGTIRGKGRHRTTGTGKFFRSKKGAMHEIARTHPHEDTAIFENLIKHEWMAKYSNVVPTDRPLCVAINVFMMVPKVSEKRKRMMLDGLIRPTIMPDYDNLEKIFTDGLEGLAFRNDKQIVDWVGHKWYSETPGAVYKIHVLGAMPAR